MLFRDICRCLRDACMFAANWSVWCLLISCQHNQFVNCVYLCIIFYCSNVWQRLCSYMYMYHQVRKAIFNTTCFHHTTANTASIVLYWWLCNYLKQERLSYKNTPVHRIVPDFVVQMGDITVGDGTGGTAARFPPHRLGRTRVHTSHTLLLIPCVHFYCACFAFVCFPYRIRWILSGAKPLGLTANYSQTIVYCLLRFN